MLALMLLGCMPKTPAGVEPVAPSFELPVPGPMPDYTPPAPEVRQLSSGATLWIIEDHLLPLVSVQAVFDGGARLDPVGKWGRATLAADMMDESAGDRSAVELSAAQRMLASDIGVIGGRDSIELTVRSHAERLEETMALAADVVLRPAFKAEDWSRVKDQHENMLAQRSEDAGEIAGYLYSYEYYGADHPLGRAVDGTPESVAALTLDDLKLAWAQNIQPEQATFVVVGDVTADDAAAMIEASFDTWPAMPPIEQPTPPESWSSGVRPGAGRTLLVDMPGAQQTAIRLVGDGYAYDSELRPGAQLANIAVGGSFTSRLNSLLRTELGYTYGAYTSFIGRQDTTLWRASTSVRVDATVDGLIKLLETVEIASEGFSEEERTKAAAQLVTNAVNESETRSSQTAGLAWRARLGMDPGGAAAELAAAQAATAEDMARAARAFWDTEEMMILLVGDKEWILGPLEEAGFAVEVITEPGRDQSE